MKYELKLKQIRQERGMNQAELAQRIGVTRGVIGTWERGEINLPLDKACEICDALECTLEELAGWEPIKPKKVSYFSVRIVDGKPEIVEE